VEASTIGLLEFFGVILLILIGMPVGFAMILAGIIGFWVIGGWEPMLGMIGMVPFNKVVQYTFTCVPLFVFMGSLAFRAGIARDLYEAARLWTAKLPGGLAQATCLANAFFGAISGSTIAATATFSKLAVPEMERLGYDTRLAAGCVAAAGPIASVIPPSINVILYGMITEQSIGAMLIAGILPGILVTICFMTLILVRVKRRPSLAGPPATGVTLKDAIWGSRLLLSVLLTFVVMIGGIYKGIFTPTEGGAVGAFMIFVTTLILRRFTWHLLLDSLFDTARTMATLYIIVVGAFIFSTSFAITRLPDTVATFLVNLPISPLGVLIVILFMYIILGAVMDTTAMLFMTMPVIFPATLVLGYDPIWFGILIIIIFEIGMVTPPYGLSLFAAKSALPDTSFTDIMLGVLPFVAANIVALAILIAFPTIVTFLPNRIMFS